MQSQQILVESKETATFRVRFVRSEVVAMFHARWVEEGTLLANNFDGLMRNAAAVVDPLSCLPESSGLML